MAAKKVFENAPTGPGTSFWLASMIVRPAPRFTVVVSGTSCQWGRGRSACMPAVMWNSFMDGNWFPKLSWFPSMRSAVKSARTPKLGRKRYSTPAPSEGPALVILYMPPAGTATPACTWALNEGASSWAAAPAGASDRRARAAARPAGIEHEERTGSSLNSG